MKRIKTSPPKLAKWIVTGLSIYESRFAVSELLEEEYLEVQSKKGAFRAWLWFWFQTFCVFVQYGLTWIYRSSFMFSSYVKIAIRNIQRYRGYNLINVAGLAVGMICFILIMLYVKYELSFDSFHKNSDRIYRVALHLPTWNFRGSTEFSKTTGALGPALIDEYPEVLNATRINGAGGTFSYIQQNFNENGLYADEYFFDVFTYPLIVGNEKTALKEPFSIIITEELAQKYFGDEDPLGKIIRFRYKYDFTVTGVLKEIPKNSFLKFEFVYSFASITAMGQSGINSWGRINYETHIVLDKNINYKGFEKKLVALVEKNHNYDSEDQKPRYYLQQLKSIHLHSNLNFEVSENSNIKYIYLFSSIAVLILVIACINYVNSATARSTKRFKEVGIRKTIGAQRIQLIRQFLGESFLISFIALIISLVFLQLILPAFSSFVNRDIEFSLLTNPNNLLGLFIVFLIVGFVSGTYPAFLLASFRPINVLQNKVTVRSGRRPISLRNLLVLVQFCITVLLVIFTVVIQKQLYYVKFKDVGFDRENIVVVNLSHNELKSKYKVIKDDLLKNPNIYGASFSNYTPINISNVTDCEIANDEDGEMVVIPQVNCALVDYDFIEVNGFELVEGRNFSPEFTTDGQDAVIINETAIRKAGIKNGIGKRFTRPDWEDFDGRVIGVVKDFHFTSLKLNLEPVMFLFRPQNGNKFLLKISSNDISGTLDYINSTIRKYSSNFVFDYYFLDDAFNNLYKAEQRAGTILLTFSVIAIFIASLGLVGLIAFIAEQSTKEVGIRKTLGASVTSILIHISKDFLILVLIANVISWPIGYYLVNNWLQEFAYKTDINLSLFLLSGLITLVIAILTVSYQSLKTARANPVDALRYE